MVEPPAAPIADLEDAHAVLATKRDLCMKRATRQHAAQNCMNEQPAVPNTDLAAHPL